MTEKEHPVDMPINEEIKADVAEDIKTRPSVSADTAEVILQVKDLKMYFPITRGLLKRTVGYVKAVDGVSFSVKRGQTLGIVGESGSGKSTIGKCIVRQFKITDGSIVFNGRELSTMGKKEIRKVRKDLQMITQDPYSSLDPRKNVRSIILEGPRIQKIQGTKEEENSLVERMMTLVGLNPEYADRYPHEFSGGQRQRIAIARSLALSPSFIICDEIVSALDVSIQAQIVELMQKLQRELGLSYVFIGHDLSVVRHISNNVLVLYLGKVMEMTSSDELYSHPLHPYTQALISAAPIPNPEVDKKRERILLEGEIPSSINPPPGCKFCTRCKYADERCQKEEPALKDVGGNHLVACHRVS